MAVVTHVGNSANSGVCWQNCQHEGRADHLFQECCGDGSVMEVVVWRVPRPVPPKDHGYKYRAVYAVDGVRVVGFENERGKGDHCHLHGRELPYTFTTVEALVEGFIAAVDAARRRT